MEIQSVTPLTGNQELIIAIICRVIALSLDLAAMSLDFFYYTLITNICVCRQRTVIVSP